MNFKIILLIFLLLSTNSFSKARDEECREVFYIYNINPNIKSYKGWMRVCSNDKLDLYTNKVLTNYYKSYICQCFENDVKSRNIESGR